jgi:hypothetical protein
LAGVGNGPAPGTRLIPVNGGKDNEVNALEEYSPDRRGLPPLGELRRPALLLRTARIALRFYRRERDLPRILGPAPPAEPPEALALLQLREAAIDLCRRHRTGGYLPSAHVAVLAALLAEARRAAGPALR